MKEFEKNRKPKIADAGEIKLRRRELGTNLLRLHYIPSVSDPLSVVIQRAARLLRQDLNHILRSRVGISLVDFRLLFCLNQHEPAGQKELIDCTQMEQGQVSRLSC